MYIKNDGFYNEKNKYLTFNILDESIEQCDHVIGGTELYFQEIISCDFLSKTSFECFFRPIGKNISVDEFYKNITLPKLYELTCIQIKYLSNLDFKHANLFPSILSSNCIYFNVEPRVIHHVKNKILQLKHDLSIQEIELVIEVTERFPVENKNLLFRTLTSLSDSGVKIALDDFNLIESPFKEILKSRVVNDIKIVIPRGYGNNHHSDNKFVDTLFTLKEKYKIEIIIDNIDCWSSILALNCLPFDHLQGFLFGIPKKLNEISGARY